MTTYHIDDTIVRTENATASWEEETDWDGRNRISRATGSQWRHQKLYRSRRGRYWLECTSDCQGRPSYAEWISPSDAARWLLLMDHEVPSDLAELASTVEE